MTYSILEVLATKKVILVLEDKLIEYDGRMLVDEIRLRNKEGYLTVPCGNWIKHNLYPDKLEISGENLKLSRVFIVGNDLELKYFLKGILLESKFHKRFTVYEIDSQHVDFSHNILDISLSAVEDSSENDLEFILCSSLLIESLKSIKKSDDINRFNFIFNFELSFVSFESIDSSIPISKNRLLFRIKMGIYNLLKAYIMIPIFFDSIKSDKDREFVKESFATLRERLKMFINLDETFFKINWIDEISSLRFLMELSIVKT